MEETLDKIVLEPYSKYKDAGVEWLGEIPEHWELTRLGTRFLERKTKVSDKDFPPLSVTKNGVLPQLENAAKSNDGDNRKLVKKGDFVINSRSDRKGSSGISDRDGSVSLIYIVIEPINIDSVYCNYLLRGYNFIEEFYRMGHGIVADLWTTRYDEMKAIMVGIPPIEEQTMIANFLDDKTSKIDQAIAIKQKQIGLLKERRQILIHKAVTRGLNDKVKLKDSGVEWIGEIPQHWDKAHLKWISKIYAGGTPDKNNLKYWENGTIPWIASGEVNQEVLVTPTTYITEAGYRNSSARWIEKDSLIVALAGQGKTKGMVAYLNIDTTGNQSLAAIRPNKERIYSKYLFYFIMAAYKELRGISGEGQRDGLNLQKLGDLNISIPNLIEQNEISEYIETASLKISKVISLKEQEIEKLKEYKMSLMDSVVTGKVRVS